MTLTDLHADRVGQDDVGRTGILADFCVIENAVFILKGRNKGANAATRGECCEQVRGQGEERTQMDDKLRSGWLVPSAANSAPTLYHDLTSETSPPSHLIKAGA